MIYKVNMDFRMSGYFNREFNSKELEEFEAGYGELNLFIKNKIHEFKKTMFQEIDNYKLDLSIVKPKDTNKQEDSEHKEQNNQDEISGDNL